MSKAIILKRSAVEAKAPTTESLRLGELAINTYDGKVYLKKSGSSGEEIINIFTPNVEITGSLNLSGDISSSNAYFSGEVGIGTSSPTAPLDVTGDVKITGSILLGNVGRDAVELKNTHDYLDIIQVDPTYGFLVHRGSDWGGFSIDASGNTGLSASPNGKSLKFYTNNFVNEVISITGSNVGIGTDSPSRALHVSSSGIRLGGTRGIYADDDTGTERSLITINSSDDILWGATNAFDNMYFDVADGQSISFRDGGTTNMRILGDGKVGIGIASPDTALHVSGNIKLEDANNTYIYLKNPGGTGNSLIIWEDSSNNDDWYFGQTGESGYLRLYNYLVGAEHLRFNEDGTTGISGDTIIGGAVNPSAKLDVRGNSYFSGSVGIGTDSPNASSSIHIKTGKDGDRWLNMETSDGEEYYFEQWTGGSNGDLQFRNTNGVVYRMYEHNSTVAFAGNVSVGSVSSFSNTLHVEGNASIGSGYDGFSAPTNGIIVQGNVGIGTTTAPKALTVEGDISGSGELQIESADPYIISKDSTGTYVKITGGAGTNVNYPRGSLLIGSDDTINNVGLWVAPDVTGEQKTSIMEVLTSTDTSTNETKRLTLKQETGNAEIVTSAGVGNAIGTPLEIHTYGNDQLYLDASGSIGIGNTSPQFKLHLTETDSGNETLPLHLQNDANAVGTAVGISFGVTLTDNGTTAKIVHPFDAGDNRGLVFYTYDTSLEERMRIQGNGRVGIGNTSPPKELTVEGDISGSGDVRASTFTSDSGSLVAGEGFNKIVVSNTAPASPAAGDIWIDIS